jgi:hypothetical protein
MPRTVGKETITPENYFNPMLREDIRTKKKLPSFGHFPKVASPTPPHSRILPVRTFEFLFYFSDSTSKTPYLYSTLEQNCFPN